MRVFLTRLTAGIGITLLLAATLACKSDVDKVVDWQEATSSKIQQSTPVWSHCKNGSNQYREMMDRIDGVSEEYERQIAMLYTQNVPESAIRSVSDSYLATTNAMYQALLFAVGWTEQEAAYCGGWLDAEHNPRKMCETFSKLPPVAPVPGSAAFWRQHGAVGYCIENAVPPFR